jgi:hypothetical protein
MAMANLTMAFESEGLLGMIYKAMNRDWQAGLVHLAVVQLFKKYIVQTIGYREWSYDHC